jgi:two-component system, cell cycle sensor histidine kinase and response regulator CckA
MMYPEDIAVPELPSGSHGDAASARQAVETKESAASFRLLFLNHPQPMWVYDLETLEFLEVNEAAVATYGYSRDEFLEMRITDIRPAEEIPRRLEDTARNRPELERAGEWRHRRRNGHTLEVEVTSHALRFAGRNASLVVVRDVSEQKRALEALRQAEQKYRKVFEEAIVGIFQSAPEGRYLDANPAMARMFGYDSPRELMESITDIPRQVYVDPKRREEFARLMEQQGVVQNFECQVYRKDGSKMWLSVHARVIREKGVVIRYEGMNEDITELKLLQEQLVQAQKMEAVGRLAGGVAHDFNNAIAVIFGYSALLKERVPASEVVNRYIDEINKAGQRAASLTRQLLAFSRKQVIQPAVLDLNAVVAETEKMLQRLIGEDIKTTLVRAHDLGRVKADPGQIEQILMNLAVNARDAMPQGGKLVIETANADLDETTAIRFPFVKPGRYVLLSVSDTGCGMDRETQAHIFEPFFTTKGPGKGTGLGLSTVYGIVKQSEGYIWVYSELGKGTNFKIYLPRVEQTPQPLVRPENESACPRGSETILLVEDEEQLRRLTRYCLAECGYNVVDVPNGEAAIRAVSQHNGAIHLLLTDVIMPGISGRELAESLMLSRPEMRTLYMSGYTADLVAQHGVLDAGTALLDKPFTREALLQKVRRALDSAVRGTAAQKLRFGEDGVAESKDPSLKV